MTRAITKERESLGTNTQLFGLDLKRFLSILCKFPEGKKFNVAFLWEEKAFLLNRKKNACVAWNKYYNL